MSLMFSRIAASPFQTLQTLFGTHPKASGLSVRTGERRFGMVKSGQNQMSGYREF